jgi:hypothetical protein
MNTRLHPPTSQLRRTAFRRQVVRPLLLMWMVVLVAPCVHCLPMAMGGAPAEQLVVAASAPAAEMPGEMPADCPMHAKAAERAEAEPPAEPDCPKPSECCLTEGAEPVAVPEGVQTLPSPAMTLAELPALAAVPLPAPLPVPRELGDQRSHAPPSFLTPLRI